MIKQLSELLKSFKLGFFCSNQGEIFAHQNIRKKASIVLFSTNMQKILIERCILGA